MRSLDIMLALIRYEMFGRELPRDVAERITPECLASLYKISAKHDIGHLVGDALERNGIISGATDAEKRFLKARDMAVYRHGQIAYELKRITDALESAGIDFIPLKGSVIRQYYPKPWMRTSCDIDILIHKEALDAAKTMLIDEYGYRFDGEHTTHDISLYSQSGVHLELHYDLHDEDDKLGYEIISDIWSYTEIKEGTEHHYLIRDDAFYFYHVLHMINHFLIGGCGMRTLLDQWLLNHRISFDKDKRTQLLERCGFTEFADATERLSEAWFSDGQMDELLFDLEEYILTGGVYGSSANRISVQQLESGGRFKYLLSRIFISNKALKRKYPILEKRPYLAPIYHVKRWFKLVFDKKTQEKSMKEVSETARAKHDADKTEALLKKLNI